MNHDINKDTPLVPYIIAERALWTVMEKDKRFNKWEPWQMNMIVFRLHGELVTKAETLYKNNEFFRKQINDKRKDARHTLEMFMEHWSLPLLKNIKQPIENNILK